MIKKYYFLVLTILYLNTVLFSQSDTTKIVILHANDIHSKIDKMPVMAYYMNLIEEKEENVLLFCAGDIFTGNPIVDRYFDPGFPIIEIMNKMGFDISCLGNHEFDYGQAKLQQRIEQSDFPFVCANIEYDDNAQMMPLAPYKKIILNDVISIGVLGLIQIEKNKMPATNPVHLNGLKFSEPIKTAKNYETYKDSTDIFIALSHLGVEKDIEMAEKTDFFDIIIGGHTHTRLDSGLWVNDVIITQAGSYANYLGVMTILYHNNSIVSVSDSLIDLSDSDLYDKEIRKMVDEYNNNADFNTVLGFAENDISGKSNLGAMMTDAMRDTLKVDIAFQNIGGIRTRLIPEGEITKKQILELSPFGNTFVIYELNVKQIKKLIEYAYYLFNSNEVEVSGVEILIKLNKKKKIDEIFLYDYDKKIIEKGTYSVAINDYMANSYELKFLKKPVRKTNVVDSEATMNFIKKYKKINYQNIERVKVQ